MTLRLRTISTIAEVPAHAWDACANPAGRERNPFVAHGFLHALETSGSATAETGWQPVHLLLEDEAGSLRGAVPLYLKSHSYGEYVFDHAWADAWHRAGGSYYPKLLAAVPFTPVTGPRLLVPPGPDAEGLAALLRDGLVALAKRLGVETVHVNFPSAEESPVLTASGWLERLGQQFHWFDRGYGTFDGFLAALSSDKRKNLRKERRKAAESGLTFGWRTGHDLTEAAWDAFFACYMDTGSRKWGTPYLTRHFFSLLGTVMSNEVLLVTAERDGRIIAGALNLIGSHALFGRNWGAIEHHPFLHFELCYYQAIDFALMHGLARVEAGAQGEHKLARGYEPVVTRSLHWISHTGFRRAVSDYLHRERSAVAAEMLALEEFMPFRRADGH